ncbi:unnamed protein product [Caenorhabditis brenneri]
MSFYYYSTIQKERTAPVRRTSPGKITDRIETFEATVDFMEPIDVIWKKKTVTLPNLVRCIKCHGLMSLYMDLRHARDKREKGLLLPAYQCLGCQEIRPIGAKFNPDQAVARGAWPAMEFNSPATRVRHFDEEVEKRIGKYNRRNQRRLGKSAQEERQSPQPRMPVAQAVQKPRVPVGNIANYSLAKLVQKVLVVAGRVETEDAEIDEEMMDAASDLRNARKKEVTQRRTMEEKRKMEELQRKQLTTLQD